MSFQRTIESIPSLRDAYGVGLHGVAAVDRRRIRCNDPRSIQGSVNIDVALREDWPTSPRWDYLVGLRRRAQVTGIWIEVHEAESGHCVRDLLAKREWLDGWIHGEGRPLKALPSRCVWIATGAVAFRGGSNASRRLAEAGIEFPRKQLTL